MRDLTSFGEHVATMIVTDFGAVDAKDQTMPGIPPQAVSRVNETRYDEMTGEPYEATILRVDRADPTVKLIDAYCAYVSKALEASFVRGDNPVSGDFVGFADWQAARGQGSLQ